MLSPTLRSETHAFMGFVERQKNLVKRYWLWEAVWLVYSLVSVLSIGYLAAGLGSLGYYPVRYPSFTVRYLPAAPASNSKVTSSGTIHLL